MYIACPKCDWRHDGLTHWTCTCGHEWDTFATHGVCPNCGKVWTMTRCVGAGYGGCSQWSDHEDWYHDEEAPTIDEYLTKDISLKMSLSVQLTSGFPLQNWLPLPS
jgi:hypothetical protein